MLRRRHRPSSDLQRAAAAVVIDRDDLGQPASSAAARPARSRSSGPGGSTPTDLFPHWIDADGDGCTTRNEVLIAEATTRPTVGSGCALTGGRWYSYYDGASWTVPADLDIDHFVPLAEAWDSGARTWTTTQRRSFANDLGDSRSLVAVTDNVNQAKGDQDPATWLPTNSRCRYVTEWLAVKLRWRLTVDTAEKNALTGLANGCTNVTITVTTAI